MGRSSKQRAALKSNRMVSSDGAKELFNSLPINNIKRLNPILTVGRVFPLLDSSSVFALIPLDKRNGNWVSYVPFVSSKSPDYFGFVVYSDDFSQCFVMAFSKSSRKTTRNDSDFTSMFGYTYKEIQEAVTIHILRVLVDEIK